MPTQHAPVQFVLPPFMPIRSPALGVSLLVATLKSAGIKSKIHYLNIEYSQSIGFKIYDYIARSFFPCLLVGEMIFTSALWDREYASSWEEIENFVINEEGWRLGEEAVKTWKNRIPILKKAQEQAPNIIKEWADQILSEKPRIIGFSSTFQQNIASLALAKEIRKRVTKEQVSIIIGGANCEGDMGRAISEHFPFIDYVVSGEAEGVIIELSRHILNKDRRSITSAPLGVFQKDQKKINTLHKFIRGEIQIDIDESPFPIFDDYIKAIQDTPLSTEYVLSVESSRGCWWGAKSQCTFCGLNGQTIGYRSKTAKRFLEEILYLKQCYTNTSFAMTDSILDMKYIDFLFPEIVRRNSEVGLSLFYEVKANLTKSQLITMAAGGLKGIQPGIESLSNSVLTLMRKGVTRMQNIQLLKWCTELDIDASWNILYGFPGEDPEVYLEMAELVPSICHLIPPNLPQPLRLDRFAPYWSSPEIFGIKDIRSYASYDYVYPGLPAAERKRLAYFFQFNYRDGRKPQSYVAPIVEAVEKWQALAKNGTRLELEKMDDKYVAIDTRPCRVAEQHELDCWQRRILRVIDRARTRQGALAQVNLNIGDNKPVGEDEFEALVDDLVRRKLVLEVDGKVLSLIVDRNERERIFEKRALLKLESYLGW